MNIPYYSVSAIQWLCNAEKSIHNPYKRLKHFFQTLYRSLVLGARCCFQFYPENPQQLELITKSALESGFTGGVVVDYPHSTKAKKYYLFIQAGFTQESIQEAMKAIPKVDKDDKEEDTNVVKYNKDKKETVRNKKKSKSKKAAYKSKNWILEKKSRQTKQGKSVRKTTRYTGRKRRGHHLN